MATYKGCHSELEEGIGTLVVGSSTFDEATIAAATATALYAAAGQVGTTEVADSAITSVKQAFVSAGSPPTGGYMIQGGAGILGAGFSVWLSFPKKFTSTPYVIPSPGAIETTWVAPSTTMTASALILGSPTVGSYNWIAIGSGAF
jgi:hypothetical protein